MSRMADIIPHRERKSRAARAVTRLCESFPKHRVRVNSEFHLSILPVGNGQPHDIWLPRTGAVKYKLAGGRKTREAKDVDAVVKAIVQSETSGEKSDLTEAREARDLATLIAESTRNLPSDINEAVFVDAGWKNGIAQIGFVRLLRVENGIDLAAASWPERCESPQAAEMAAIEAGASFAPNAMIYSDCKVLVDQLDGEFQGWLRWLPRERNKAADQIANRRGK